MAWPSSTPPRTTNKGRRWSERRPATPYPCAIGDTGGRRKLEHTDFGHHFVGTTTGNDQEVNSTSMTLLMARGATTQGSAPTLSRCRVSVSHPLHLRHWLALTVHMFAPLAGAVASMRQLATWGPANIEQYIAPLIERAAERALALRMTVPPRAARSNHMIGQNKHKHKHTQCSACRRTQFEHSIDRNAVCITRLEPHPCTVYCVLLPGVRVAEESGVSEDDLQVIAAELLAKGIHVSIRGTAIRISPNVCVLLCILAATCMWLNVVLSLLWCGVGLT